MNTIQLLFVTTSITLLFSQCGKKHTPACDGSSPTYDNDIQAIITSNCGSCHGSGSSNGDMSSYAALQSYLDNGKFESEVLSRQTMPPEGPLSDALLDKLQCWVNNGYPE